MWVRKACPVWRYEFVIHVPSECKTELSSEGAAASGGCIYDYEFVTNSHTLQSAIQRRLRRGQQHRARCIYGHEFVTNSCIWDRDSFVRMNSWHLHKQMSSRLIHVPSECRTGSSSEGAASSGGVSRKAWWRCACACALLRDPKSRQSCDHVVVMSHGSWVMSHISTSHESCRIASPLVLCTDVMVADGGWPHCRPAMRHESWGMGHKSWVMIHVTYINEAWVMGHGSWVMGHESWVVSHESWDMSHVKNINEAWVTSHK